MDWAERQLWWCRGGGQISAFPAVLSWAGVSGLLAFHAHPDDEVLSTGGVLSKYAEAGEFGGQSWGAFLDGVAEVVVVTATDGAEGEVHNYGNPEEIAARLVEVRAAELAEALSILGVESTPTNIISDFLSWATATRG